MKIGIVGNYGNDNNGDEAILLGILQQLLDTFPIKNKDITVFSNNPTQTEKRFGVNSYPLYYKKKKNINTFFHTYRYNKKFIETLDFLIIGGGGILMDLYRREAQLYGTYALMAKTSNIPYVVYGCGAGPIHTSFGKWSLRFMAKHANSISVRDFKSRELLKSIGVRNNIEVIGDPAFTLKAEEKSYSSTPKKIGVSAVPYYNANYWPEGSERKYNSYVNSMAKNLDKLVSTKNIEVTFFSTKFPHDVETSIDIYNRMVHKENVKVIEKNLSPLEILQLTTDLDIVIGTRLHSLILATNTQTPIIAVSYHTKVNDFMSLAQLSEYCFSMDAVAQDDSLFTQAFSKMFSDWQGTVNNARKVSNHLNKEALKGISQFQKAVKEI